MAAVAPLNLGTIAIKVHLMMESQRRRDWVLVMEWCRGRQIVIVRATDRRECSGRFKAGGGNPSPKYFLQPPPTLFPCFPDLRQIDKSETSQAAGRRRILRVHQPTNSIQEGPTVSPQGPESRKWAGQRSVVKGGRGGERGYVHA